MVLKLGLLKLLVETLTDQSISAKRVPIFYEKVIPVQYYETLRTIFAYVQKGSLMNL